jgi:hypothetical protein
MYKLIKDPFTNIVGTVQHQVGNMLYSIPFDPYNTDYQTFKKEVLAGAELQDADGNMMTQEQANQFVGGLA